MTDEAAMQSSSANGCFRLDESMLTLVFTPRPFSGTKLAKEINMRSFSWISLTASLCLTTPAMADETTLIVDFATPSMYSEVITHFARSAALRDGVTVLPHKGDQGMDFGALRGPMVLMHQAESPDTAALNTLFQALGQRPDPATVMTFFETAEDYSWVADLDKPDNVKLTVSIREFATDEIAKAYSSLGVTYSGPGALYNYGSVAEAAVSQITPNWQHDTPIQIQGWSPDVASVTMFDSFALRSGANADAREQFLQAFRSKSDLLTANRPDNGNVLIWRDFSEVNNDIAAIARAIAASECSSDFKWDGQIAQGMSYQAFGQ